MQPRGHGLFGPAGQHVDGPAGGDVNEDRGVHVPAADREVVDAHYPRSRRHRLGSSPDRAKQAHPPERHGEQAQQALSGPPAQGEGDRQGQRLGRDAVSGIAAAQTGDLLDERDREQPLLSQKNRRTVSSIVVARPPIAGSCSRRW